MKNVLIIIMWLPSILFAQQSLPVITAFPSLMIPASSRGISMGGAGIASSEENQQLYYNVAKPAFILNKHQASVSYMPWMNGVTNDVRFINANYMVSASSTSSFGAAVSYLNLGNIYVKDDNGATLTNYHASEYNVMGSYALKIGERGSIGAAFHLLGENVFTTTRKNKFSVSSDISYYGYAELGDASRKLEWGAVLSNLGPKVTFENVSSSLPANAGFGVSFTNIDPETDNQYSFALDVNRLIKEDWKALRLSLGGEFGLAEQFFLRGGASFENQLKGSRKYFSLGAGYKGLVDDQSWGIDIHYLIPFGKAVAISPFQNSYGFTLHLTFGNFE